MVQIGWELGEYQIIEQIGGGGMAVVYKAEKIGYRGDRQFAVKVLRPELIDNEDILQRFHKEGRDLENLRHQNIVTVHDNSVARGEDGEDYHCLVLDYIGGGNLKDRIGPNGMDWREACRILKGVCEGLEYMHAAKKIHRDIKPQNILLDGDRPIIADFGIARGSGSMVKTSTGTILGTPEYMSPEQALGGNVDPRTDIYALGIVLYEMLTGRVPFPVTDRTPPPVVLRQQIDQRPSPVRQDIPSGLNQIVRRALQKKPEKRFQSARSMQAALDGVLGNGPGDGSSHSGVIVLLISIVTLVLTWLTFMGGRYVGENLLNSW